MSHQFYRNYNTLMEAELAALQDIGYTIDRRNFYRYSVYGDGLTITNNNPYFAAMLTVRIISPIAIIQLLWGWAYMFMVAKTPLLRMQIYGIAVSFDFGHNARGDGKGYRGSYILDLEPSLSDKYNAIYQELNGALVSGFDVTGRVAGQKAAIFMSENAYVEEINIMQGAGIFGDIISDYEQFDDNHNLRLTELRFGLEADAQGRATNKSDANFTISYAATRAAVNSRLQQAFGGTPTADVAVLNYVPASKTVASASAIHAIAPETVSQSNFTNTTAWASGFGNWSRQSGNSSIQPWRLGVLAG